jgi:hypothetical protein
MSENLAKDVGVLAGQSGHDADDLGRIPLYFSSTPTAAA